MRQHIYETRLRPIRRRIAFFIVALAISGLTVWPAETELRFLLGVFPKDGFIGSYLAQVLEGYQDTAAGKPYLLYGYDWLAFAHLVLAVLFIGPYRDPVRNKWVIEFGLIACLLIFPLAFICGGIRGIPVWWRLVDCSFGVFGFAVLWPCYKKIKQLEKEKKAAAAHAHFEEEYAWA
jgi:hypothetical protein